ncbi:hypothetical protein EB231_34835 [Mesorhizobium sp. NZP2298]|nr:hypothetical protein EB231_34835 [Mesorhizobium sp. NZP2298]
MPIASVTDNTHIVLDYNWPGTTASGATYSIALENASAASVVDLNTTLSRVLVTLSLAGITPDASGTLTDRAALSLTVADKGFLFLHAEIGVAFAFYRWTGTAWDGPFAVANASGGAVSSLAAGTGITVDATNPAIPIVKLTHLGTSTRNHLINGNGAVNQRGATAPTDDTYGWDRHNLLTQTAAIAISTLTNVANGLPYMMRMTQSQATAQRMGNSQIIESRDCIGLRGKTVTLIGKLRNSLAAATRYAILEWTGTADTVTSDIVNSWTNGTFTAGQFFNSTTLNVLAVGAITPTAATVTNFLLTATVGASANNLIVFIWTETAQAQSSTLDVAWELLDYDATGKTYPTEFRPYAQDFALCQRYYVRLLGGGPGTRFVTGQWQNTTDFAWAFSHPSPFRTSPSVVSNDMTIRLSGVGNITVTGASLLWTSGLFSAVAFNVASGGVTDAGSQIRYNSGTSYIEFSAEL